MYEKSVKCTCLAHVYDVYRVSNPGSKRPARKFDHPSQLAQRLKKCVFGGWGWGEPNSLPIQGILWDELRLLSTARFSINNRKSILT